MKSTEERVQEMVDASLPSIANAIKEELRQTAVRSASNKLQELVSTEVTNWFKANMASEIQEALAGEKGRLLEEVNQAASAIAAAMTESLSQALAENLKTSYRRTEIFKALFQ